MPITATERPDSRSYTEGQSHERTYFVEGTSDHTAAVAAVKGVAPLTDSSLTRGDCTAEPLHIDTVNEDKCIWLGSAPYTPSGSATPLPAVGDTLIQGTTGGGTQTLRISIAPTTGYAKSGATAPDFDDAIGVNGDKVDGVEIGLQQFDFTVTKVFPYGSYPSLGAIYNRAWTWNNAEVTYTDSETGLSITLAAGECLFKSVDFGRGRGDGGVEFAYHMSASPNRDTIPVGGGIVVSTKLGWEYLWLFFATEEDTVAHKLVQAPVAAYVAPVYKPSDHSYLGI